jgi:hypothetical protein
MHNSSGKPIASGMGLLLQATRAHSAYTVETFMSIFLAAVLALVLLAAAGYAQVQIPRFTAGGSKIALTRSVLVVIGIAFGLLTAGPYANAPLPAVLGFLIGFGAVHVPAAIILFVKRERRAGKS